MKKISVKICLAFFCLLLGVNFSLPKVCRALTPGALVYRTSAGGKMYGYSGDPLIYSEKGIMKDIYPGHVGIYIGKEDGVDYIVEALTDGIVMTPADKFVNEAEGEKYLGAKIPKDLTAAQQAKVVKIARSLAGKNLAYDFDYKTQKGPDSGEWTCVGLAEKIYESADISNPNNLDSLEYDYGYYAVDITADGFDDYSVINSDGDCFSTDYEFSKIARRKNLLLPAPELIGYDVGLEIEGERFIFLPYTQFLQPTLADTPTDIKISSSFSGSEVRGAYKAAGLVARWSLINNPISSIKIIAQKTGNLLASLKDKVFGSGSDDLSDNIVFNDIVETVSPELGVAVKARAVINKAAKSDTGSKDKEKVSAMDKAIDQASGDKSKKLTAKVVKNSELIAKSAAENAAAEKNKAAEDAAKDDKNKKVAAVLEPEKAAKKAESTSTVSMAASYYTPASAPVSTVSGGSSHSGGGSSSSSGSSSSQPVADYPKIATISRVYATGDNDYVELYNPTDYDFDLAAAGYRIEVAKTSKDPNLAIEIGNTRDGSYPGGTVIKAKGYYLIVKSAASDYYLNKADAIAIRKEFTWPGSAHTIYLATAAVSASTDEDIVEAIGFGNDATYFQGNGPAQEIKDYYVLKRTSDTCNNDSDFNLIKSDDPEIDWLALEINNGDDSTATSSDNIATSTPEVASSSEEVATSTDPIATSTDPIATSTDPIATSTDPIATSTEPVQLGRVRINKIYATRDNDYIELYNPTDYDFNLETAGYRLSKAETLEYPDILMRIGDPGDGSYPGGTVIKAHSAYLIVRDEADDFYKSKADAIATREDFTWDGSGHTIYLGKDAVSSSTDPDIVEAVGFGTDASYWRGAGPAAVIADNYVLNRIAEDGDNKSDFNLIKSDDPNIDWSGGASEELISNGIYTFSSSDYDLFPQVEPIDSSGLKYLWHFDECSGNQINSSIGSSSSVFNSVWAGGKFDCAQEGGMNVKKMETALSEPVDINNFSISFWFKTDGEYPRLSLTLSNSEEEYINVTLESGLMQFDGLPNPDWRYYTEFPFDNIWRQAVLVVNRNEGYWAFYVDGQEKMHINSYKLFSMMDKLKIDGSNGLFVIDEVAVWDRALPPNEVYSLRNIEQPFAPIAFRSLQTAPVLKHFWNFNEGIGTIAGDAIGDADLTVDKNSWNSLNLENSVFVNTWGKNIKTNFPALESPDISLTFKWRSTDVSNGDRNRIVLRNEETGGILTAIPGQYISGYEFAGKYNFMGYTNCLKTPEDTEWHDIAVVYDSYRYLLRLFVDGNETENHGLLWPADRPLIDALEMIDENGVVEIDDLGIWEGALSPKQIKAISANN